MNKFLAPLAFNAGVAKDHCATATGIAALQDVQSEDPSVLCQMSRGAFWLALKTTDAATHDVCCSLEPDNRLACLW